MQRLAQELSLQTLNPHLWRFDRLIPLNRRLGLCDHGSGVVLTVYKVNRYPSGLPPVQLALRANSNSNRQILSAGTRAVIALGSAMSLTVIAEGIETAEQRDFLRAHGCPEGQGFSRSVPAAQYTGTPRERQLDRVGPPAGKVSED